jgi:hypothetical protein
MYVCRAFLCKNILHTPNAYVGAQSLFDFTANTCIFISNKPTIADFEIGLIKFAFINAFFVVKQNEADLGFKY